MTGTEDGSGIIESLNVKPYERPTRGTMPAPVMQTKLPIGQIAGQQVINNEEKIVVTTTEKKPLWTA